MVYMNSEGISMIEFCGDLCGNAKEFFYKKTIEKLQFVYLVTFTCIAPLALFFMYKIGVLWVFWIYPLCVAVLCLIVRISFKKGNKDILIKRVYVEGKYIFSVSSNGKHKFKIESVKKVIDYGDFYFVAFSKLLVVEDIVCQKKLLTKGTLEEFESLFEDKIFRVN